MPAGMTNRDSAMYGSNKPAWHRHPNSRVVEGQPDAEHAIEYAGLGWRVESAPAECGGVEIPNHFVTFRDDMAQNDPHRFLGVVQGRYQIVQNREVLTIADDLIGESGAKFETLGSLWGGRQCYATVVLPGEMQIKDDRVDKFLVLKWSHDGTCGIEGCITPVRVVCANTVAAAFRQAKVSTSIRHTNSAVERIGEARRILGLANDYYDKVGQVFNAMASTRVDDRFVDAYLKAIIPDTGKKRNTRSEKTRAQIASLFYGGQDGAEMEAVKGTAWGLYNATTQYIDHDRGTRAQGRDANEARFDAVMWGTGARLRQDAFGLIGRQTGILEGGNTVAAAVQSN